MKNHVVHYNGGDLIRKGVIQRKRIIKVFALKGQVAVEK